MKLLIGFTTLLIAVTSFAQTKPAPPHHPELPAPPVYGQGSAKISITKSKFVKQGDNYKRVTDNVCEKTISFDIYDIRNDGGAHRWETSEVTCETEVNGVKTNTTVMLMAIVGKSQPEDTIKSDIFNISMGFYLITPRTSKTFQANIATRDLDTKSLMSVLGAAHQMDCNQNTGACNPIEGQEIVNAQIEYLGH